ncbi:CI116 protein, partial [Penelope pileata]|nr:CI116 protein [Penelope pileata]
PRAAARMAQPTAAGGPGPRTASWYRVSPALPGRFQQPSCFRGYGAPAVSVQHTSFLPLLLSQTSFHVTSHAFSNTLAQCGMYRDDGLNTALEKSHVTGPANFITPYDTLNFHPSYNVSGPSHC